MILFKRLRFIMPFQKLVEFEMFENASAISRRPESIYTYTKTIKVIDRKLNTSNKIWKKVKKIILGKDEPFEGDVIKRAGKNFDIWKYGDDEFHKYLYIKGSQKTRHEKFYTFDAFQLVKNTWSKKYSVIYTRMIGFTRKFTKIDDYPLRAIVRSDAKEFMKKFKGEF